MVLAVFAHHSWCSGPPDVKHPGSIFVLEDGGLENGDPVVPLSIRLERVWQLQQGRSLGVFALQGSDAGVSTPEKTIFMSRV